MSRRVSRNQLASPIPASFLAMALALAQCGCSVNCSVHFDFSSTDRRPAGNGQIDSAVGPEPFLELKNWSNVRPEKKDQ